MTTFGDFWQVYPRHIARKYAEKCWNKLKPPPGLAITIVKSVEWYKQNEWKDKDSRFIPHASTFLNQFRFEDVPVNKIADLPNAKCHHCTACDPEHDFFCAECPWCGATRDVICQIALDEIMRKK